MVICQWRTPFVGDKTVAKMGAVIAANIYRASYFVFPSPSVPHFHNTPGCFVIIAHIRHWATKTPALPHLNIPPVIKFYYQGTVPDRKWCRKIIIGIYKE
jgi:hypothetical protein